MDSNKETMDHKSDEEDSQQTPNDIRTTMKCRRKNLWNPSSKCETHRTVVVNYNMGHKRKSIGAIPKRREAWTHMIAALNDHTDSKAESECDIYNLRKLYQMSRHSLGIVNSHTSSTICEASTSNAFMATPVGGRKNHDSLHSIRVDFFDMPPVQEAQTEEHPLVVVATKDAEACRSPNSVTEFSKRGACPKRKHAKNSRSSTRSIKVEIINFPLVQEAKPEEIQARYGEINPEEAQIIVISSGDEEDGSSDQTKISEMEIEGADIRKESETTEALMESAGNSSNLYHSSTKSTQKPEARIETHTQTQQNAEMHPKLLQIPSSSSSLHYNSVSRSSPLFPTHKQRQLELHRLRVQVEKKRLELLEMKLKRERDEMMRDQILFDRELETIKTTFKELNDEKDA